MKTKGAAQAGMRFWLAGAAVSAACHSVGLRRAVQQWSAEHDQGEGERSR